MLGHRLLILLTCCAAFGASNRPNRDRHIQQFAAVYDNGAGHRLPNNTRPISYDIHITTKIHLQTDFDFTGQVAIRLVVAEASRTITLHQRYLTIGKASLVLASRPDTPIALDPFENNYSKEFLTFILSTDDLIVGSEYILTISYSGSLRRWDRSGFYASSYRADDGSKRFLATTQFELTDARHGFPCYDEPALRAWFTIRITHGSTYQAISNMPVASLVPVANAPDLVTTQFEVTSGPTSTYLIAFIVSDFEHKSRTNAAGFVQRVFARPTAIDTVDFALDTGVKLLDAFEQYFGIAFALPKMDQVAIPDFWPGAMENWGLVTYAESNFLYNESRSTSFDKFEIANVIAHEYTHQWFGNLVTPSWYNYVWLKEGFADMFSHYALDWVFPEWNSFEAYVPNTLQTTMLSDVTDHTGPIDNTYVEYPYHISKLYGISVYQKAGIVLRMMLNAFTEESFKKGIISYLNKNAYSSATEDDLFAELDKAVKADQTLAIEHDVATIYSSWTHQAGFPLVVVQRNYVNGQITLSQERYLAHNLSSTSSSLWWIPINVASATEANFQETSATCWFGNRSHTFTDASVGTTDWLLLNKGQTGYYRVQYDRQNYQLLADQLWENFDEIDSVSRSNLIDDAFELARVGRLDYYVALDLTKYMKHELDYVPWASFFRGLELVDRLYARSDRYDKFKYCMRNQMAHLYQDAGLTAAQNEPHFRKVARNLIIEWSCGYGSPECLYDTNAALNDYLLHHLTPHQDHWPTILRNSFRNGTDAQLSQLFDKLSIESDPTKRLRLITVIGLDSHRNRIQLLLARTLEEKSIYFENSKERLEAFKAVVESHTLLAIEFLVENFDAVSDAYKYHINPAVEKLSKHIASNDQAKQFEKLLSTDSSNKYVFEHIIQNARKHLDENQRWIDRNVAVIDDWVDHNCADQVLF